MLEDSRLQFLASESTLARQMREADWSASPLGPAQEWPQSLRSVVGVLLGSAFPMFVAWGPQLAMLYNDAYADILGRKHPDSLGAPFERVWSDILDAIMPFVQRALAGESFFIEDLPLRMHRRGFDEDTWFTFSYSPVRDESGEIVGFFCACAETTRAVLAQRQLHARHEWLTSLFDQAPGFAAVLRGPGHVFDMVNEAYRRLVGGREVHGKKVMDALPEVQGQGFIDLLDQVYASGQPYVGRSVPLAMALRPGMPMSEVFVDFMYQPLRNAEGTVEGIFVQGHDVTEQVRAQRALREADRQKDEFLATLAHELRNPLAPVRTAAYLLERPEADAAQRRRAVAVIGRQVGHMTRLLDDLIDIARITQRRLVLRKDATRLGDVINAAVEAARPLIDAKQHELRVTIEPADAIVHVDPVRITQVISNLLNNAAKYTDAGGRVSLDATCAGGTLRVGVQDNGIGISPAHLSSVFAMFAQREEALTRSEGGLGIGLALAKGLVDLHGGTLRAHSGGVGQGSRFELELPLGVEAAAAQAASETVVPAHAGRTVLLADDNRDAAELMAECLSLSGYQVLTALDGEEALALAERTRPQVLVLDIGMPRLSGHDVARRVRELPWGRDAVLVAATGWGQPSDREKAVRSGFDVHLTKPFAPDDLVAAIEGVAAARLAGAPR